MMNEEEGLDRPAGFSLVEVLMVLVITVIIFLSVFSIYLLYSKTFTVGNVLLDIYSNSRTAAALLMRDIGSAAQVESSCASGGVTYTTTDSSIVLKVPSVDSSGNIISDKFDEIVYRLSGSDLYRIVIPNLSAPKPSRRPAVNRAVAHNCGSLTFSSGGVTLSNINGADLSGLNTIAIRLPVNETVLSLSGAGTVTATMVPTTVVRLRNK